MIYNSNIVSRTVDWWKPKAVNILAVLYLAAIQFRIDPLDFGLALIPSLVTIMGIGILAYILNDWVDLPFDRLMNKKNMLTGLTSIQRFFFLLIAVVAALIPWFFLPKTFITFILLGTEFLLVIVYSTPPIRLKTKGFVGVLTDALYAYAIPAVLAYFTFSLLGKNHTNVVSLNFFFLFLWQFFSGIYNMCIHQLEDFDNDIATKTNTWATAIGKSKIRKVMLFVFWPSMIVFFLIFLFTLRLEKWEIFLSTVIVIVFKLFLFFIQKGAKKLLKTPFSEDFQRINLHYHFFLPLIVLFFLTTNEPAYIYLFLFHISLFSFTQFSSAWFIGKKLIFVYLIQPFHYHFFRNQSRSQSRKEIEEKEMSKPLFHYDFNVAVMNRNKDKYTETFVKYRVLALKEAGYNVHYLYGDDLPTESEQNGTLLSNYATIRYAKKWFYAFMDKSEKDLNEKTLRSYLLNHNIKLVLAEFGTVGKEVAPVCLSLKIPYVITFYGYDFHHESTFRSNENQNIEALNGAEGIIGVSKEITFGLRQYLTNPQKVSYLPCLVNSQLFLSLNRNPIAHQFIGIGRFTETKAPNLTILAFSEVLKTIPAAKLIMIGKDGGGELFESCLILAKALGIEKSIDFKGICKPEEIAELMQLSAVFVQHSLTTPINKDKEGTPVSVMEAMCAGLPIVSTRHAGIMELIVHEESGLLVDEYDWKAMANEMIRLASSPELSNFIGGKARQSILNNELIVDGKQHFIEYVNLIKAKFSENEK
jgi:colanic acid/amylovoran biosynthesis glycosyltransferase